MKSNKIGLICILFLLGAVTAHYFKQPVIYGILIVLTGVTVIAFQQRVEQEAKEKHNKG